MVVGACMCGGGVDLTLDVKVDTVVARGRLESAKY